MGKLTFYVQQRIDGGRRTGIDIDGDTVFERFETGDEEFDPALLWYIDLRCAGDLPSEPDEARDWLIDHRDLLTGALKKLSDDLEVGLDSGLWPRQQRLEVAPRGVEILIVCSSLRRIATPDFGQTVARLAEEFTAIVRSLGRIEAATR
jgi:hypothetical protein